jgi:hypothetical protein
MANPLKAGGGNSGSVDLRPGETRILTARDKSGNVVKEMLLTRTTRDYVFDLCDAYNDGRTAEARERGLEWFVTPAGELRLGDSAAWSRANLKRIESRNETERSRFNRHQLEAARRANDYEREAAE